MAATVLSQELLEERLQEARRTYKLNVGYALALGLLAVAGRARLLRTSAPELVAEAAASRTSRLLLLQLRGPHAAASRLRGAGQEV